MENSNKNININNNVNTTEDNIPANEKRVKKIISGNVVTKPKNKISKFFSKFLKNTILSMTKFFCFALNQFQSVATED